MANNRVIAVLGATGMQGGALARTILADPKGGFVLRAITRDPDKKQAQAFRDAGAEVVKADIDDVESLKKAFAGAYGLYAVTNFWEHFSAEREKQQARNIAAAAKAAGVKHVIWSTLEDTRKLLSPDDKRMPFLQQKYRVPHFDAKAEADSFFAGLPVTYLMTSFYWDNLYMFGQAPKPDASGNYSWAFPMDDRKLAGIAAEDIGKVAYGIFQSGEDAIGKRLGVLGQSLTIEEMGQKLARVMGTPPIHYHNASPDEYRGYGFPGADEMGNMFQIYRDFEKEIHDVRSADTARSFDPELQSFDQFLEKNKSKIEAAMKPAGGGS